MPQFTTTVIAVAFILLAVGAVIGLLVLLYDWLAPLISRTTHGVSLPDSIGDLVSRLRRRRSRDDEDGDDDDDAKDDDIASEPFYEVACPNCGETVYVSEDDLDAGEANCAHCGVTFEVALEGDEEEPDEDAPVQYEVTCPDCGTTAVFEEEELLEGEPKCPNCGKPLDFEVTEE